MVDKKTNTQMLQEILEILAGMKDDLVGLDGKIGDVDERLSSQMKEMEGRLETKIDKVGDNLSERVDKLGYQLAELDDDAPTRDEFDDHEERLLKLEKKAASA